MPLGSTLSGLQAGVVGGKFRSSAGEGLAGEDDTHASHGLSSRVSAWRTLFGRVRACPAEENFGKITKISRK